MLANSHKLVATNVYNNVFENYGVKLDKDKLLWGSIAPDILPKYRFIRHYQKESLDYVVNQIINIIVMSRYMNFNKYIDIIGMKILSREIGIVSHYLTDFVCMPHAKRWTFVGSMKKHLIYEKELDIFAKSHDFKNNVIDSNDINLENEDTNMRTQVKAYIERIVEEYSLKSGFNIDLNFAAEINVKITYFILDTINSYSEEIHKQYVLGF